jgi:hypothetical protein
MLHPEVTSNFNSDTSEKTWSVWLHFYVFGLYVPLINKCIYPVKVVKLLLKYIAFVQRGLTHKLDAGLRVQVFEPVTQ